MTARARLDDPKSLFVAAALKFNEQLIAISGELDLATAPLVTGSLAP